MDAQRLRIPALISALFTAFVFGVSLLPDRAATTVRAAILFVILTVLIGFSRRVDRRLGETIQTVKDGEAKRDTAIETLARRADALETAMQKRADDLSEETDRRHDENQLAMETQTATIIEVVKAATNGTKQ